MVKSTLLGCFLFCFIFAKAQKDSIVKDTFVYRSIPTYDMNGNQYSYENKLDHYPTKEDTILMEKQFRDDIRPLIDSVENENRRIETMNLEYRKRLKNYAPLYPREGKHLFSLHWISLKKFGSVTIKKINQQKYSVKGEQRDNKGNYVTINGFLKPVNKGEMKFVGEIQSKFSGNNKGEVCKKKGEFTFLCKKGNKYWQLQERENCEGEGLVDNIDIFF